MPSLKDMYRTARADVEACYDNPLHTVPPAGSRKKSVEWPCHKACDGPGVPGYFDVERCQLVFVSLTPSLADVENTARIRLPFSDATGQLFNALLEGTPLYGDRRVGFTTLVKCHLKNKRTLNKVIGCCSNMLEDELRIVRPATIVCMGEIVAKALCPELFFDGTTGFASRDGTFYTALDRTYYFMRDPFDKDSGYYNDKGVIRESEATYVKWVVAGQLNELAATLVPDDWWFHQRHATRQL